MNSPSVQTSLRGWVIRAFYIYQNSPPETELVRGLHGSFLEMLCAAPSHQKRRISRWGGKPWQLRSRPAQGPAGAGPPPPEADFLGSVILLTGRASGNIDSSYCDPLSIFAASTKKAV